MSNNLIQPRTLKGFRDYLPETMIPREQLMETARRVYRSFGFSPIDTPALEYHEILAGKGGEEADKQMFRFTDNGKRDVAMRFDLTVPLARFVAQYANDLGMPFKRYHIAPVWRGENPQKGRYREFIQCDFDTIGTTDVTSDIETGLVIHELFVALGVERFTIRLNNRQVLNGLLEAQGLREHSTAVLRALDKLAKIGRDKVAAEMSVAGLSASQSDAVLQLAELSGSNAEILDALPALVAGSETGVAGVQRLREVIDGLVAGGADPARIKLDVSIARGLDYYTGVIFETFLDDLPGIGSVCSGGRYDNLANLYTKQELPGIGASLGLDRLLAALEELGLLAKVRTPAKALIVQFDAERRDEYLSIATELRRAGIAVEVYPEAKKLKAQLKYANNRGFAFALIAGGNEFEQGVIQVKDLESGEARDVPRAELVAALS